MAAQLSYYEDFLQSLNEQYWTFSCLIGIVKGQIQALSAEPSNHGERIQTGISAIGCARVALDMAALAGRAVDAVRKSGQPTVNGIEVTAPLCGCCFARRGARR
jgi:hypothetical protein